MLFILVKIMQKCLFKVQKINSKYGFGHPNLNFEFKKLWATQKKLCWPTLQHYTEVRFAFFLSGVFTNMAVLEAVASDQAVLLPK